MEATKEDYEKYLKDLAKIEVAAAYRQMLKNRLTEKATLSKIYNEPYKKVAKDYINAVKQAIHAKSFDLREEAIRRKV